MIAAAGEEFDPYLFLAVRTRQMRNACDADDSIERCHCLYKVDIWNLTRKCS